MTRNFYTRRDQLEELRRLTLAVGVGLVGRLKAGEALPTIADLLSVIIDDYKAEVGVSLLSMRECEALIVRLLIATPQPGFKELSRYYLSC